MGEIPRADVAAVIAAVLVDGLAIGEQFELISGDAEIPAALARVGK
jgi:hypothetical protein